MAKLQIQYVSGMERYRNGRKTRRVIATFTYPDCHNHVEIGECVTSSLNKLSGLGYWPQEHTMQLKFLPD